MGAELRSTIVVGAREVALRRGRQAYARGRGCPPMPASAAEWMEPAASEWAGWMIAMRQAGPHRVEAGAPSPASRRP